VKKKYDDDQGDGEGEIFEIISPTHSYLLATGGSRERGMNGRRRWT